VSSDGALVVDYRDSYRVSVRIDRNSDTIICGDGALQRPDFGSSARLGLQPNRRRVGLFGACDPTLPELLVTVVVDRKRGDVGYTGGQKP